MFEGDYIKYFAFMTFLTKKNHMNLTLSPPFEEASPSNPPTLQVNAKLLIDLGKTRFPIIQLRITVNKYANRTNIAKD